MIKGEGLSEDDSDEKIRDVKNKIKEVEASLKSCPFCGNSSIKYCKKQVFLGEDELWMPICICSDCNASSYVWNMRVGENDD